MPKYKLDAKPSTSSVRLVLRPAYYNTYATVFVRSVCLLPWISTTCAVRSPLHLSSVNFRGSSLLLLCSGPRSEFRACEALKSPGSASARTRDLYEWKDSHNRRYKATAVRIRRKGPSISADLLQNTILNLPGG